LASTILLVKSLESAIKIKPDLLKFVDVCIELFNAGTLNGACPLLPRTLNFHMNTSVRYNAIVKAGPNCRFSTGGAKTTELVFKSCKISSALTKKANKFFEDELGAIDINELELLDKKDDPDFLKACEQLQLNETQQQCIFDETRSLCSPYNVFTIHPVDADAASSYTIHMERGKTPFFLQSDNLQLQSALSRQEFFFGMLVLKPKVCIKRTDAPEVQPLVPFHKSMNRMLFFKKHSQLSKEQKYKEYEKHLAECQTRFAPLMLENVGDECVIDLNHLLGDTLKCVQSLNKTEVKRVDDKSHNEWNEIQSVTFQTENGNITCDVSLEADSYYVTHVTLFYEDGRLPSEYIQLLQAFYKPNHNVVEIEFDNIATLQDTCVFTALLKSENASFIDHMNRIKGQPKILGGYIWGHVLVFLRCDSPAEGTLMYCNTYGQPCKPVATLLVDFPDYVIQTICVVGIQQTT
jgi:hypothetical protein